LYHQYSGILRAVRARRARPGERGGVFELNTKSFLSPLLSILLLIPSGAAAQQVSGPASNLVEGPDSLKIVVIQGEGAQNSIRNRTGTAPVVEVRDENDKPVEGAEVVFQLPAAGPGGVFHGWMRNQTARTNAQGQASASGFTPNEEPGRFNIKVTATTGKKSGTAVIAQSNVQNGGAGAQARKSRKGLWIALGVIAVAAIVGGVVAAGGDDDEATTPTTPVTITPGPVTVGNPR
jgi:hypothetical protein